MGSAGEVVERLMTEERLSMADAAKLLGVHAATAVRHCHNGVKLPTGGRLTLEHYRVGAKMWTTREAVARFIVAQQREAARQTPTAPTPRQQQRETARAVAQLEQMGA